jgi:hypothetical protein
MGMMKIFLTATKRFFDQYDVEYNRNLEPGGGLGDYYYQLRKRAISLLRGRAGSRFKRMSQAMLKVEWAVARL